MPGKSLGEFNAKLFRKLLAFFPESSYTIMAVLINTIGAWLSLVERFVRDEEVVGSNPVAPIFCILFYISQIYFSKFAYKTPVHCPYSI